MRQWPESPRGPPLEVSRQQRLTRSASTWTVDRSPAPPPFPSERLWRVRRVTLFDAALLLVLAWGALAFGGVYPWAYWPLAVGAITVGGAGLMITPTSHRLPSPSVIVALAAVAVAIMIQIAPLPGSVVSVLSPSRETVWSLVRHPDGPGAVTLNLLPRFAAISLDPISTARACALYAAFVMLTLGVARRLDDEAVGRFVPLVVGLGLIVALLGIFAKSLFGELVYGVWEPRYQVNAFGPFLNRNHFGGWILMVLPLTVGYCCGFVCVRRPQAQVSWRDRVLWLSSADASVCLLLALGALILAVSLTMAMSRSSILSFIVITVVLGLCAVLKRRSVRGAFATVVLLAAMIVVAVRWAGVEALDKRFTVRDSDVSMRLMAWKQAIRIARQFEYVGTGVNTYWLATAADGHSGDLRFHQAHNDYLQLLAEGGFLLAGPVVIALIVLIREAHRRFKDDAADPIRYWIRLGAVAGLCTIALQEGFDFSLQVPGNAAMFAVLLGIAIRGTTGAQGSATRITRLGGRSGVRLVPIP